MDTWPSVSVVMPVRNGVATIGDALDGVLAQDYPGDMEVVVADGGSIDGTTEVVARFAGVHLVPNPAGGTPSGLNAAIAASRGEVVVRCDAHAVLPPGYVRRAVEVLEATGADNVGGVQDAQGVGPVQRAVAAAMSSRVGVGDANFHIGGRAGPADTVYLGVFRRATLERLGGFDERLERNQDYELNLRIREGGGTVWFDPSLRVLYRPRASFRELGSQYWQYGRWKRRMVTDHPGSLRWRQAAPPVFVVGVGGCVLAGALGAPGWWLPPTAYALVVIATGIGASLRHRDPALLLTPIALATMHVSWGLGFLAGPPADGRPPQRLSEL